MDMCRAIGLAADLLNAVCVVSRAEPLRTHARDTVPWPNYNVHGGLLYACWRSVTCAYVRENVLGLTRGMCARPVSWEGAPRYASAKMPGPWPSNVQFRRLSCLGLTADPRVSGTVDGGPSRSLVLAPAKPRRYEPLQGEVSVLSSCGFLAAACCMAAPCHRSRDSQIQSMCWIAGSMFEA